MDIQQITVNMRYAAEQILKSCDILDKSMEQLRQVFNPATQPLQATSDPSGIAAVASIDRGGPKANPQVDPERDPTARVIANGLNEDLKEDIVQDWRALSNYNRFKRRDASIEALAHKYGLSVKSVTKVIAARSSRSHPYRQVA